MDENNDIESQQNDEVVNSIKSDDIPKKKRIILRFPDGTYSHGEY